LKIINRYKEDGLGSVAAASHAAPRRGATYLREVAPGKAGEMRRLQIEVMMLETLKSSMDLRSSYPRSIRVKLGVYLHLARMIDKCRAKQAGTLGEYLYPCPIDQLLLNFCGFSGDEFFQAIGSHTDEEVLHWFQAHAAPHTLEEIETWNIALLNRKPDTDEKREYFLKVRDNIDPTRTDITTWADLLDLDEGRKVPARKNVSEEITSRSVQ
jgi:Domain of unknown function (DUF5069)